VVGIGSSSAGCYFVYLVSKAMCTWPLEPLEIETVSTGGKVVIESVDCATETNPSDNAFCNVPRYDRNAMSTGN
jgi:hypothetical protein